ncbi:MAG: precorrin-6A reductase [Clostridia bacterium]|nr:precorrin-6A reductase [Clostridia bacterium]
MSRREKICLFAGTTEGRQLAQILHSAAYLTVCVATEYGEVLLDGIDGITVHTGRMDADEMARFFADSRFDRILDATHPYAEVVTENICTAAKIAGIPVMRILRETDRHIAEAVYVPSVEAARDYLIEKGENIFLTTGAKELSSYIGLDMSQVWARVLPLASSLESCQNAGILPAHIIAAQGPFTEEINLAQMKMIGARYMVTKSSGKNGGFEEKIRAAKAAGAIPVIIGQPPQVEGFTLDEALVELAKILPLNAVKVTILGIGPGDARILTAQAQEILQSCDAVIGAKSVADSLSATKPIFHEFLPEKVREVLHSHPSIRHAAVVMRGDVGFYSGAKKLIGALGGYDVTLVPGISSPLYFAAKLGISWDDAALISLHGRDSNLIHTVKTNRKVFALTGGDNTVDAICRRLCEYGYGELPVTVGERLSYPEEKITHGTAAELIGQRFDALSILYIENERAVRQLRHGIPDEEFIRGDVPMTKSEVRTISLSKLELSADTVVYDIGAGTGSVSVECALAAYEGQVYAIEKEADAASLIAANKVKFGCENLHIVEGIAPDALANLPAPTHAFIGGSSGNLRDIIAVLLRKNPNVRIVVNAFTLETQTEAAECARVFGFVEYETVSVNIARSRKVGRYHMMTAQNPVYVITMEGGTPLD